METHLLASSFGVFPFYLGSGPIPCFNNVINFLLFQVKVELLA